MIDTFKYKMGHFFYKRAIRIGIKTGTHAITLFIFITFFGIDTV